MSDTRTVTVDFLRRVAASTKHGPDGRRGACFADCVKCEVEILLAAPPPAPVCHNRPHGEYDPPCDICDRATSLGGKF